MVIFLLLFGRLEINTDRAIKNCKFDGCYSSGNGGAILVTANCRCSFESNTFIRCRAGNQAGAIYADTGFHKSIRNTALQCSGGAADSFRFGSMSGVSSLDFNLTTVSKCSGQHGLTIGSAKFVNCNNNTTNCVHQLFGDIVLCQTEPNRMSSRHNIVESCTTSHAILSFYVGCQYTSALIYRAIFFNSTASYIIDPNSYQCAHALYNSYFCNLVITNYIATNTKFINCTFGFDYSKFSLNGNSFDGCITSQIECTIPTCSFTDSKSHNTNLLLVLALLCLIGQ